MKYISLPDEQQRHLSFYLAMEEYVAREMDCDDAFFMWQVDPTVIFGRNQVMENEVNIDYCRRHHIEIVRRKSGGGCVYADRSNVMFSYITKEDNVNFTYNRYINMLLLVLHELGIEARSSGRNDLLIDGRKVSGNAFYHLPGKSIVHGTLLYDTNMEHMVGSITPSDAKLVSKGVKSVRQHIALLKDYTTLSLEQVKHAFRSRLCDGEEQLDSAAVARIEAMRQEYLTPTFLYGRNPAYTLMRKQRIEGVGELEMRLEVRHGVIRHADLTGDFFLVGDMERDIIQPLIGTDYERSAIEAALPDRPGDTILHLTKKDLTDIIIQ